jgi:hypothetical protein
MKYAMFVVIDPDHAEADVEAAPDLDGWFDYVKGKGAWVAAAELHPRDSARRVRVREGELLVTDATASRDDYETVTGVRGPQPRPGPRVSEVLHVRHAKPRPRRSSCRADRGDRAPPRTRRTG